MNNTLITAHNGADKTPENSMAFVRHALASGADALEIDIRRRPDGALVFTHDLTLDTSVLVPVREVFQALRDSGTGMRVNCDLKEAGLESDVAALADECGIADLLQFSGTVSAARCREAGLTRRVEILLNIEEYVPEVYVRCVRDPSLLSRTAPEAAEQISGVCLRYGIGCVNTHYRLATDAFIDTLDRKGLRISVWTVNDPAEAGPFLHKGIYNLTTRNLQEILPLAARQTSPTYRQIHQKRDPR